MKRLYVFLFTIILYACHSGAPPDKYPHKAQVANPILKNDIIGDWVIYDMYAGIDTANTAKFPDINLESGIYFYNNGRFKKKEVNYTIKNHQERLAGYMSDYKVKGDTLFVYEPRIKHWYALYATMRTKDRMEIGSRKGYDHLDTHYFFIKVKK